VRKEQSKKRDGKGKEVGRQAGGWVGRQDQVGVGRRRQAGGKTGGR
jgi:hypothetical protein